MTAPRTPTLILALFCLQFSFYLSRGSLCAQDFIFDDFSSGNDSAWTRYQPLAPFGAPGVYSFPNGGYRIQATASPNSASLGPGRAGSLRLDLNITANTGNFLVDSAVIAWDNTQNQSYGLLGRITTPGFGTTKGYAFTYSTSGLLAISSINNETQTVLTSEPYQADPAKRYDFTFRGTGATLVGELFELLPSDGKLPVAIISVDDRTYNSGVTGLGVFSNVGLGTGDATFDNFEAFTFVVPEPSAGALILLGAAGLIYAQLRRRNGRSLR